MKPDSKSCRCAWAKKVENKIDAIPSTAFLIAAIGALGASHIFKSLGKKQTSIMMGQLPSFLLLLGMYNKMGKKGRGK